MTRGASERNPAGKCTRMTSLLNIPIVVLKDSVASVFVTPKKPREMVRLACVTMPNPVDKSMAEQEGVEI